LIQVDEYGPALFHTDPSGTFVQYEAKAIGAGSEGAQTNLQESYSQTMTLAEAEALALSTLKQVMEEKLDSKNVELSVVKATDRKYKLYSTSELETVIARL